MENSANLLQTELLKLFSYYAKLFQANNLSAVSFSLKLTDRYNSLITIDIDHETKHLTLYTTVYWEIGTDYNSAQVYGKNRAGTNMDLAIYDIANDCLSYRHRYSIAEDSDFAWHLFNAVKLYNQSINNHEIQTS